MAMNRTGIPTLMGFSNGGGVENEQENTDTSGIMSTMLDPQDVTQNFALYSGLLDVLAPEPRRLTGYDLASELGKGLLAQQGEKFPSLGRGIGLGFQSFKQLSDQIDAERKKAKRERDALAFGLATKSKPSKSLRPGGLYKSGKNVFNSFMSGENLIFKGYDKDTKQTFTISDQEFFAKYPDARPITDGELSGGFLKAGDMNKLQLDIVQDKISVDKLAQYLTSQKERYGSGAIGFKLLADDFTGLMKTILSENKNLTEDELRLRILKSEFQGLIGGFRIETVGPGVMTEFDAQRVVESLGGEPGALQNPILVAQVLQNVLRRKVDNVRIKQGQYNEQIDLGNYDRVRDKPIEVDMSLFEFDINFPEESTNRETKENGSLEYDMPDGKRYRLRKDGVIVDITPDPLLN